MTERPTNSSPAFFVSGVGANNSKNAKVNLKTAKHTELKFLETN